MFGKCPICSQKVPLITIKNGGLFDSDKPYEVCLPHTQKKWIRGAPCEGANMEPEIIWQTPVEE